MVWQLLGVAAAVSAILFGKGLIDARGNGAPGWGDGYPRSLVVLPFRGASSTEAEREAAVEVADLLSRELDWWDEVRALGSTALSGIIHDLGVDEPTFRSSSAALRVAVRWLAPPIEKPRKQ